MLGQVTAGSGLTATTVSGGNAGTVLYRSATNVTTFSNATNGVLQNIGNVVNFTTTPTTIQTITAPSATNLTLTTPTALNTILLKTNFGDVNFDTTNGVTNVWTIAATTGHLSSATSNISLTTDLQTITISDTPAGIQNVSNYQSSIITNTVTSEISDINSLRLRFQSPVSSTTYQRSGILPAGDNFEIRSISSTKTLLLQTNAGNIALNTNNGGTNAWTVAATTGLLSSATSNISLTGGNVYLVSSGSNSSQLAPSVLYLTFGAGTTNFFGNQMITTNSSYAFRTATAASILALTTNAGDINMSTNTGTTTAFNINSTNQIRLPLITNAPFLTTDVTGIVAAGTVLGVANGGTGASAYSIPKVSIFTTNGTFTFTGTPKYITVEICSGGGGGGGSVATNAIPGGGAGGSYGKGIYVYNATVGFYTFTIGSGGVGGAAIIGTNGTAAGPCTFTAGGVLQFTVNGGLGGIGGSSVGHFPGGRAGTVTGTTVDSSLGSDGEAGADIIGGSGGGSRMSGHVSNAVTSGSYDGTPSPGPCSGGASGRDGEGGNGGSGKIVITEYYL